MNKISAYIYKHINVPFANWIIKKFSQWAMKEQPPRHTYLSDFDRICYEIRPGDVLLFEGRHRISRIIRQVTQSPWTHAALYIGRLHDIESEKTREQIASFSHIAPTQQLIVESLLGQGTIVDGLEKYRDDHIRICRPVGLSREDAQKVINYSISRLGTRYSVRHIFDLARLLFPYAILPRHWRSSLFEHNALRPTEEICSSMIARAFNSIHFPILPLIRKDAEKGWELVVRNPRLITPSDFDYSPYFAIIKYPIFSVGDQLAYRNLPWVKNVVYDDRGGITSAEEPDDDENLGPQKPENPPK